MEYQTLLSQSAETDYHVEHYGEHRKSLKAPTLVVCCAARRFRTMYPSSSRPAWPAPASLELTTTLTAERCNRCWWRALLSTGHASSCVKFGLSTCATGSVTIVCPSNFASIVSIHCEECLTGKLHPKTMPQLHCINTITHNMKQFG